MANENERDDQFRQDEQGRDQDQQGLSSPDHEQGAMGGSVTAAGGSSSGPGAGSAGLDRDFSSENGFVGSEGDDSGEYLQDRNQPNQGGFAEDGQGAPEGTQPGNIEGNRERDESSESDIEGSGSQY